MHYDGYAFAIKEYHDGYTMKSKKTLLPVEKNHDLSPQDFELLNIIYHGKKDCVSLTDINCTCGKGMERKSNGTCLPDCSENDCDKNAVCTTTETGYDCQCREGYYGTGKWCLEGSCYDNKKCQENEECPSSTAFSCECKNGYERKSKNCLVIDRRFSGLSDKSSDLSQKPEKSHVTHIPHSGKTVTQKSSHSNPSGRVDRCSKSRTKRAMRLDRKKRFISRYFKPWDSFIQDGKYLIPFEVDPKLAAGYKAKRGLLAAFKKIELNSSLKFVERTDQQRYLKFKDGFYCGSLIGQQKALGPQDVTLGPQCWQDFIILHQVTF